MQSTKAEITAIAARLVVEEGLDFGTAKRRAAKQTGGGARTGLPDNLAIEEAVEEYIAIFCADTQPAELRARVKAVLRRTMSATVAAGRPAARET